MSRTTLEGKRDFNAKGHLKRAKLHDFAGLKKTGKTKGRGMGTGITQTKKASGGGRGKKKSPFE